MFRCANNNFWRDSRQFAFVIWTFKSDAVTSASPVFKTTCNRDNICYDFFKRQLERCTTVNLCRTAFICIFLLFVLLVCIREKLKQERDVYLQLMEDFGDELMTRSGTAASSGLDTHHVIFTVWLFISCSTTGNFFWTVPHFTMPDVNMINCELSSLY